MNSKEEIINNNKNYWNEHVNPIIKVLMNKILKHKPGNIMNFIKTWVDKQIENPNYLEKYNKIRDRIDKNYKLIYSEIEKNNNNEEEIKNENNIIISSVINEDSEKNSYVKPDITSDEDEDEEEVLELENLDKLTQKFKNKKKESISAESFGKYNQIKEFKLKIIQKSEDLKLKLNDLWDKIFMFKSLEENNKKIIIDALEEKKYVKDDIVIKEGDKGDVLYLVDKGNLKCFKLINGVDVLVKEYKECESFGELALLYNAPRAATIKANSECILYALDRETFNNIVKFNTMKQRDMFSDFLNKIDIFKELNDYEKSKITDCLNLQTYNLNELIIKEGEIGDKFYLIIEGNAIATKLKENNNEEETVFEYKQNDYFGELSLIKNDKRAANIKVTSEILKLAYLDKNSFKRLLGPIEEILKRNMEKYNKYVKN